MLSFIRWIFIFFTFKPIINNWKTATPHHLWFAKKASQSNQINEAIQTPLAEIESALRIKWTDKILGKPSQFKTILSLLNQIPTHFTAVSQAEYLERIKEFYDNCIIRWLDNEIGWVVTLRPGKTLKKGFINCYTGIIKIIPSHQDSSYEAREYYQSLFKNNYDEIVVDARQVGNHMRLLPFLLDAKYLDNFEINPNIKDKIAVANLEFHLALLNGVVTPCVFAPEDITAPLNQELLLGVNYSLPYLFKMQQTHRIFKFMDKETFKPLDPELYPLKQIEIQLEGVDYSFHLPRLRIMVAEQFSHLKHKTMGFDEVKKQYYEIVISDSDIYKKLMESPEKKQIIVKPEIRVVKTLD